jgi:hypothetical protein
MGPEPKTRAGGLDGPRPLLDNGQKRAGLGNSHVAVASTKSRHDLLSENRGERWSLLSCQFALGALI